MSGRKRPAGFTRGMGVTVRGTLRVIHHPAATIGGLAFEVFTEVRAEE
jgi:hypothetical protein